MQLQVNLLGRIEDKSYLLEICWEDTIAKCLLHCHMKHTFIAVFLIQVILKI